MHHSHGFEAAHPGHEDIEKQQIETSGFESRQPFATVAGGDNAVACPFQHQLDRFADGAIVVDDQNFCQCQLLRYESESKSTADAAIAEIAWGCKYFPAPALVLTPIKRLWKNTHVHG